MLRAPIQKKFGFQTAYANLDVKLWTLVEVCQIIQFTLFYVVKKVSDLNHLKFPCSKSKIFLSQPDHTQLLPSMPSPCSEVSTTISKPDLTTMYDKPSLHSFFAIFMRLKLIF